MKITEMRVNHVRKPMGHQITPLSFGWRVTEAEREKRQKWARITIKQNGECVYDSGEDVAADSLDYPVKFAIKPRTRYDWTVIVCTESGEKTTADSWFETGKMEEEWEGKWITPEDSKLPDAILEKKCELTREVKSARLYICGLGVYEVYINGMKIGTEYLAPGYHSYDQHLQVHTYDASPYLHFGKNEIQIWLGDGWFKGRFGFEGGYTNIYGDRLYAIAELYAETEAGEFLITKTDKSWSCRQSPIVFSGIYDGEIYDANLERSSKNEGVIEKEPECCGTLMDRYSLPIVKKEMFVPIEILYTPKGEVVLDFGQNLTGWVEFDQMLPRGANVTLTAAEIMQNECFYRDNLRTAKAEYTYISNGQSGHVRPYFTFYGFRYMKIECNDLTQITNITAYHLRSDFEQIGTITTGNHKVNQLFSNALWSQKDNFLDVPTDCPQRDERMGWTGDAQVFSETACYNMDVSAFFRKYLWDMRAEQKLLDGAVPNIVPRLKQGMVSEFGICPWADAGVIIPWNVYCHYGNKTMLKEAYPGMKGWVDYQKKREESCGGRHLVKGGFHFADWLALDNEEPGPFGKTDPLFIASAYYYYCSNIVAKSAVILEKIAEAKMYEALAKDILKDIQETYFENGICICKTQTAAALTILFELMPGMQCAEGTELLSRVVKNDNHLNTGFVGTTMLCPALSETGNHQTAVELLLKEDYPSWLYSVNLGATTIWERWNSVMPDGSINPEGMNSLNHYSYGSIVAWMYQYVCGIKPLLPGFRKARIAPQPDQRLRMAECVLNSAAGVYRSKWEYTKEGMVVYEIEVPFHATAMILLPEGRYQSESGTIRGATEFTVLAGKYRFDLVQKQ